MFTVNDVPEGWVMPGSFDKSHTFFDKKSKNVRWCVTNDENGILVDYYTPGRYWVIHTPYSEGLTYEKAIHLVVTLIRLGEAERLVNESRT